MAAPAAGNESMGADGVVDVPRRAAVVEGVRHGVVGKSGGLRHEVGKMGCTLSRSSKLVSPLGLVRFLVKQPRFRGTHEEPL
eukprot:scaffold876_cov243-Pinguiococcus_pyrenoidosus.AAC.21